MTTIPDAVKEEDEAAAKFYGDTQFVAPLSDAMELSQSEVEQDEADSHDDE